MKLFKSPPVTPKKHLAVNFAADTIFKNSDFENNENNENRENVRNAENRGVEKREREEDGHVDRNVNVQTFGPSPRPKHYPLKHRPVHVEDERTIQFTPERTSNPTDIDCELRARLQVI